jgi:hypothetical protein
VTLVHTNLTMGPSRIRQRPGAPQIALTCGVPQISARTAGVAPAPVVKELSYSLPTTGPYEGPTLGMTKPDPAPTIG